MLLQSVKPYNFIQYMCPMANPIQHLRLLKRVRVTPCRGSATIERLTLSLAFLLACFVLPSPLLVADPVSMFSACSRTKSSLCTLLVSGCRGILDFRTPWTFSALAFQTRIVQFESRGKSVESMTARLADTPFRFRFRVCEAVSVLAGRLDIR